MASLADNHLSKYGRFGDDRMYKTSEYGPGDGELWHVNAQEEAIMDMYGLEGEKLIDKIGSGTINPTTGKEEKFLGLSAAAIAAIAVGGKMVMGAGKAYSSGREEEKQATSELDSIIESIKKLDESEAKLNELVAMKSDKAREDYGIAQERRAESTEMTLKQQHSKEKNLIQQSGLAVSGTVSEAALETKENIARDAEQKSQDLAGQLGQQLGQIQSEHAQQIAEINAERDKLNRDKELAQEKADDWYLGKNLGKVVRGEKGGLSGAAIGAGIGNMLMPGVGAVIGGIVGGQGFKSVGEKIGKTFKKWFSDKELKKNIKKVGKSDQGINIYEFEFKDKRYGKGRYQGVLAHEVPWASEKEGKYMSTDYSLIDVDFKKVGG